MWDFLKKFMRSGIWTYPFFVVLMTYAVADLEDIWSIPQNVGLFLRYIFPGIGLAAINLPSKDKKKQNLQMTGGKDLPKEIHQAMYPPIPKGLISDLPKDLTMGFNTKKQYICLPITRDGLNVFCVGTPGAGKSVLLIGWLLADLYQDRIFKGYDKKKGRKWNFFLIDLKGEIYRKVMKMDGQYKAGTDKRIQVVQPSNRMSYGWDVFYRMHTDGYVTETELLKMVTDLADALIVKSGDNPYFDVNAKKILTGILYWYARKNEDFIDIIHKITRSNLDELISQIVHLAEKEQNGIVLDKLKSFVGKGKNESIQDVEATMKQYLDVFSYPDIVYMLKDNPKKTSPRVLDDGVSNIDLAIEESMLQVYQPVFRLITMQVLKHCESEFNEEDERVTSIIVDEAKRVGYIEGLDNSMATLRSRHTNLILLFQDVSQFRDIYDKKADSILNLCEAKIFLSGAGDKHTTEYVSEMVGEYTAERRNYQKKGIMQGKSDIKFTEDDRPIITGKSLMQLRDNKEIIVIYFGKYLRFKKLEYFQDPILGRIAGEIKKYNMSEEK